MKRIKLYITVLAVTAAGLALSSCDDDFMNEVPQTSITVPGYFNTVSDLETYASGLYNQMPDGGIRDANSDNVTGKGLGEADEVWNILYGSISKDNVNYDWNAQFRKLRNVNVLLDNADRAEGPEDQINHWKAFGHYFRAIVYIELVQRFSNVPWIEHAIASDHPDVRRPSDDRTVVVENIMKDLDYACKNLKPEMGNKTRVHKYCALALLSRFALYEGTFRKYHDELNLKSTADDFLKIAVSASKQIIDSRLFDITVSAAKTDDPFTGIKGSPAFRALFNTVNLHDFSEIIQYRTYNSSMNGAWSINPTHYSLSRALMENFLRSDGTPFSKVSGYDKKPMYEGFAGRDPRLAETFGHPGSIRIIELGDKMSLAPYKGGYPQGKFEAYRLKSNQNEAFEGKPIYRYAEVALNFAEAKAELGQFDSEAETLINKLRDRVGMPAFNAAREADDPILKGQYPKVTDATILALRRERRSELACEGLRLQDVYRWAAGAIFLRDDSQTGMYMPALGLYDYNGDGKPDMAIYANQSEIPANFTDKTAYPDVLNWFFIKATPGYDDGMPATETSWVDGYLRRDESGLSRRFREPTDYYRPINVSVVALNPELTQMFDWK